MCASSLLDTFKIERLVWAIFVLFVLFQLICVIHILKKLFKKTFSFSELLYFVFSYRYILLLFVFWDLNAVKYVFLNDIQVSSHSEKKKKLVLSRAW